MSIGRVLWCSVSCSSAKCSFSLQMRYIFENWGISGIPERCFMSVASQGVRSGREDTPFNPYLKGGGLHICSNMSNHGHNAKMWLFPHAKILALGLVSVQRCSIPVCHLWIRQALPGPAGSLQAGSDCSKPPLLAATATEGCYEMQEKTENCQSSHSHFFKEVVLWWVSKQNRSDAAYSVPFGALQSGWKERDFEKGFSEKWISRKNVGDQPAASGEKGWVLVLDYLTFLLDLHGPLFSVSSWTELK